MYHPKRTNSLLRCAATSLPPRIWLLLIRLGDCHGMPYVRTAQVRAVKNCSAHMIWERSDLAESARWSVARRTSDKFSCATSLRVRCYRRTRSEFTSSFYVPGIAGKIALEIGKPLETSWMSDTRKSIGFVFPLWTYARAAPRAPPLHTSLNWWYAKSASR